MKIGFVIAAWTQPNAVGAGRSRGVARVSLIFRLALESLTSVGSDEPQRTPATEGTDEDETVLSRRPSLLPTN